MLGFYGLEPGAVEEVRYGTITFGKISEMFLGRAGNALLRNIPLLRIHPWNCLLC